MCNHMKRKKWEQKTTIWTKLKVIYLEITRKYLKNPLVLSILAFLTNNSLIDWKRRYKCATKLSSEIEKKTRICQN